MKYYDFRAFLCLFMMLSCGDVVKGVVDPVPAISVIAVPAPLVVTARTTGSASLSDADIARMSAEATASGAKFGNKSLLQQVKSIAQSTLKVVTNPFTSLFSLVAPLGMFVYGFFDQAIGSIKITDYMGSTISVMVNPKVQWDKLVKAEGAAVNNILNTVKGSVAAPTLKDLQDSGWQAKYAGGAVGLTYDFGFAAGGDDLSAPLGFIRSATTGKYYYRPVRGQMTPASMSIDAKAYPVDFHKRPFDVLLPRLMVSLVGKNIAAPLWRGMLDYTQLDSVKIFMVKVMLLATTAFRNSFGAVTTAVDDAGQKHSTRTFGAKYISGDKGAAYPGLANIQGELAKLIHRLKITPDIKRTVAANNGQTMPSKWDLNKIVYLGDVNPGLLLLSVMPTSFKQVLNLMFKVNVNFYEYQSAIDRTRRAKSSDVQMMYDHIRSLGNDIDDFVAVRKSMASGAYVDGYLLKLAAVQKLVSSLNWKAGQADFTDVMTLFFLLRRLLAEVYVDIEHLVTTYGEAAGLSAPARSSSLNAVDVSLGMQDQSVQIDVALDTRGYNKNIDFDLLSNQVLKNRASALKDYATFLVQYVASFSANNVGNDLIDRQYLNRYQTASDEAFHIEAGGPDDLRTYFPATAMKKTMSEFVSAVGAEAQKTLSSLDREMMTLNALSAKAKAADGAYQAAAEVSGVVAPAIVDAKVAALDDLVVALRSKQAAAKTFGLYPVGYEEKMLRIIELPGAVYLAYCLNYQMSLQSKAFEGDLFYYYDDSFYDEDSSYLNLLALLIRAQSDLSRAASVISGISGPVELIDADGKKYTVPSGSQFYLNSLQKYDQYFLLQEQNMRQAREQFGVASDQYKTALASYNNANKLLQQKKRDMSNALRSFAFDRRHGVHYSPVNPVDALAASVGVDPSLANAAMGSVSRSPFSAPAHASSASVNPDSGIAGTLDDGTVVYTYERTVNGFLQEELARFAFRARMLALDDLKELVYAVTGIRAEDLWTGVEAKKRQMLLDQRAALDGVKPQAIVVDASLDSLLAQEGVVAIDGLAPSAVEEESALVPEALPTSALDPVLVLASAPEEPALLAPVVLSSDPVVNVASLVLGSAPVVYLPDVAGSATPVVDVAQPTSALLEPLSAPILSAPVPSRSVALDPVVSMQAPEALVVAVPMAVPVAVVPTVVASASSSGLLVSADLDGVVAIAQAGGQKSYNDSAGLKALADVLSGVAADFSVAAVNHSGEAFTAALKRLVGVFASALNPSPDVVSLFVGQLHQTMGALAFAVGSPGVSDVNSFDNMLEIVTYLQNGMLATQAGDLGGMADQLNAWLKSH